MTSTPPKCFAVSFRYLNRWSVNSFSITDWRWPTDIIRPLSDALFRKFVEADKETTKLQDLKLATLHFSGEMELRWQGGNKPVKGRLWWAEPGDVIYSKIDVRHGAIGIVPEKLGRICVTSEFPVYAVDSAYFNAAYIRLLFRTLTFRRKINSMISGASGRKRVQPKDLENVKVPLPPLPVQKSIVSAWERAKAEIADIQGRISELEAQIEVDFLAALGLQKPERAVLPKVLGMKWKDLDRWSVMYNLLASTSVDIAGGNYPVQTLGDIATVSYGIQKCAANRPAQYARPYLRVANVQRGALDLSEIKTINVPDEDMPGLRLEPGDLLVCEGNSADLVGRPAIWQGEIPDCVHQNHILKVRVNKELVLPEYVLEYMQTTPARIHFRSRAKFTTNLASINSNDLRELKLAVPPLSEQQTIIKKVKAQRKTIADLKTEADKKAKRAKKDVEAMILGAKPVPHAN
ncbi:MAG: restriction endonuclease subunit S [Desulfobacterales bacterium]